MVLTVFGTTWREDVADLECEAELARQMAEVASRRPGFISYKSYVAPDGEAIGIIRFESREALKGGATTPRIEGPGKRRPTSTTSSGFRIARSSMTTSGLTVFRSIATSAIASR